MLGVKIEFCPLDWYSSSPTEIVLYKRMYKSYYTKECIILQKVNIDPVLKETDPDISFKVLLKDYMNLFNKLGYQRQ